MNQVEPESVVEPVPPGLPAQPSAPRPRRNPLRSVGDWFWRSRAIAEARGAAVLVPPRARELQRRAKLWAEAARRALEPAGPYANGSGGAIACELYRQATYWALASRASMHAELPAHLDGDLPTLWHAAEPELLLRAAGDADALTGLQEALLGRSFVDYPDFSAEEQRKLPLELRRFVESLLSLADAPQARLDRLRLQRLWRVGLVVVAFAAAVPVLALYSELDERRGDLASGRPWEASSHLMAGCKSPAQSCTESPTFFFHTAEDASPSVVIDLGKTRKFSAVRAVNRTDCCHERAVPLVVEVSSDKQRWKAVATRTDAFRNWKASFAPTSARYVRLRVTRKSYLHLSELRVLE